MITALQPSQVSLFWENIRQSFLSTNPPPPGVDHYAYTNKVLENLLTQKYVCWVVYKLNDSGEKVIHALAVTTIEKDNYTGVDTLHIISLFGYRRLDDELARSSFEDFLKYARNTGCFNIKLQSNVRRIFELARAVGFRKVSEVFVMNLKGKNEV